VREYVNVKAPVLLIGETGAGKSYWAEVLANERERSKNFVHYVDLASLNETLATHLFENQPTSLAPL
jgi:transcriptional regulator with AAA-type ATPase domain